MLTMMLMKTSKLCMLYCLRFLILTEHIKEITAYTVHSMMCYHDEMVDRYKF